MDQKPQDESLQAGRAPNEKTRAPSTAAAQISPGGHDIRLVRYYLHERPRSPDGGTVRARDAEPTTPIGHTWLWLKRLLIGKPISSAQAVHERLTKVKAL